MHGVKKCKVHFLSIELRMPDFELEVLMNRYRLRYKVAWYKDICVRLDGNRGGWMDIR